MAAKPPKKSAAKSASKKKTDYLPIIKANSRVSKPISSPPVPIMGRSNFPNLPRATGGQKDSWRTMGSGLKKVSKTEVAKQLAAYKNASPAAKKRFNKLNVEVPNSPQAKTTRDNYLQNQQKRKTPDQKTVFKKTSGQQDMIYTEGYKKIFTSKGTQDEQYARGKDTSRKVGKLQAKQQALASRTVGVGQPRKTTAGEARKTRNVQNKLNKLGVTNVQQAKKDRAVSRNKQIGKTAAGNPLDYARNYVGNTAPTKTNRQTVQRRAEQGTLAKEMKGIQNHINRQKNKSSGSRSKHGTGR